jgi:hypothetical protein
LERRHREVELAKQQQDAAKLDDLFARLSVDQNEGKGGRTKELDDMLAGLKLE